MSPRKIRPPTNKPSPRGIETASKGNICTSASKDLCQPGLPGSEPGTFQFPADVAAAPTTGNIYITDAANNRVQELTETGEFILMFGKHVNTNGTNTCTHEETPKCQAGEPGNQPGALNGPEAITVDPVTGNIYIAEPVLYRVQEYTPTGQFILMIGKEVNKTNSTNPNLCTQQEITKNNVECGTGTQNSTGSTEHQAFTAPEALAAGGPEDLLYVGDVHRVQMFKANGEPAGEIRQPLETISSEPSSKVTALTVNPAGNIYLVYTLPGRENFENNIIRVFSPAGTETRQIQLKPRQAANNIVIRTGAVALDANGHLAVSAVEKEGTDPPIRVFGILYDTETSKPVTEYAVAEAGRGIAFNATGGLYIAVGLTNDQEVDGYRAEPVGELLHSRPARLNVSKAQGKRRMRGLIVR